MAMLINDIRLIVKNITSENSSELERSIMRCFDNEIDQCKHMPLDLLLSMAISCNKIKEINSAGKVIVYGAGKVTERIIDYLKESVCVSEIWDMYSLKDSVHGVRVVKPHQISAIDPIIVALDDPSARQGAMDYLNYIEHGTVYYYREIYDEEFDVGLIKCMIDGFPQNMVDVGNEILDSYKMIDSAYPPILFPFLPVEIHKQNCTVNVANVADCIKSKLQSILLLDNSRLSVLDEQLNHLKTANGDGYELLCFIELLLRNVLYGSVKTKYRPIRMKGDTPYDSIAVMETLVAVFEIIFEDIIGKMLTLLEGIKVLYEDNIFFLSLMASLLMKCGRFEESLEMARRALHKGPDDFVANEMFYQVASECKKKGFEVDEPICELDLNKYFCWCGMNYAWCGGFDYERKDVAFSPCFRPSCIAAPRGDFFTGEEWIEFRKSLLDGTFRYCQKSQCPNLVAGWLPKKEKCNVESVKRIIETGALSKPELDEIHLSYDSHCNLRCPSCRTEFCTNTEEENGKHDLFYNEYLKKYVQHAKHLCLQGCGEAMISPHSRRILQSLSDKTYNNLKVELRTNATTITPKNWESLGEGRTRIKHIAASIDAATKENFEKIRFPAKWDVVYENLRFIQQLRHNKEIELFEFHTVIQKDNLDELEDIIKLACGLDVDVVTFSRMVNWMGKSEKEYLEINPFWIESRQHDQLKEVFENIKTIRNKIEEGCCDLLPGGRKMFINLPFEPDPSDDYDLIRYGRLKIR